MFTFAISRNLAIAAGLTSAAFALGASAPSQAATKSLFNCQGTKLGTYRCCKEYTPKPIWFKQQSLNCEGVVKCYKRRCYIKYEINTVNSSNEQDTRGGANGGGNPNGPPAGGQTRGRN